MIRFESVSKVYNGASKPAVDDVSLEIEAGEFAFLVGASGSGKSSLLRLMLREERADSGDVLVLGSNLNKMPGRRVPEFRRQIGAVFQDFRLLPYKNVYSNVAFALSVLGKSRAFIETAVPDVLRLVGLEEKAKQFPRELSGGEQQRVAIARALANRPKLLLADEPTGNLDPTTTDDIMALLSRINLSGTTVVMATHDRRIVDQMRKRVIQVSGGKIVRDQKDAGYKELATDQNTILDSGDTL